MGKDQRKCSIQISGDIFLFFQKPSLWYFATTVLVKPGEFTI